MKKLSKRTAPKRVAKKKAPKRVAKAKAPRGFYVTGKRGARGVDRTPLHVLITPAERAKLEKLSHVRKLNCADVVRSLINAAKV